MISFKNLYHPPDHPVPERFFSKETVEEGPMKGKPILEITKKGDTLYLSFIRSSESYPFRDTLRQFLCYAKTSGYPIVKLQDDALFSRGDCMYRALFYRVLEGKPSLYVSEGFEPSVSVNVDRDILYNAQVSTVKKLAPGLPADLKTILLDAPDDMRFGEWLLQQECEVMRQYLNKIETLAFQTNPIKDLANDAKQFLTSWKAYKRAHDELSQAPTCKLSGGSLRSRTRVSSGRKHKRRVTRSSKGYRQGTRGKRYTR